MPHFKSACITVATAALLTACASSGSVSQLAPKITGKASSSDTTVSIPVFSKPDDGFQWNSSSPSAFAQSFGRMLQPLDAGERKHMTLLTTFIANYEGCKRTGYYSTGDQSSRTEFGKSPSNGKDFATYCYEKRKKIHSRASQIGSFILQKGRPDVNHREHYRTLGFGVTDRGWTDDEAWARFANFSGDGMTGMTRTDILTHYYTIMGSRAVSLDATNRVDNLNSAFVNPIGAIFGKKKKK